MAIQYHETPFHAMDLSHEEVEKMTLRADLAIVIRDIVENQKWSQRRAARQMGISQPQLNKIVNGKVEKISLDYLFCILARLGFRTRFQYGGLKGSTIKISSTA